LNNSVYRVMQELSLRNTALSMKSHNDSSYKWIILALATLTNALVSAAPAMCMPVLSHEISAELDLTLVQVGLVWGIVALPAIFTGLIGGSLGDRFGAKRILIVSCILIGLTGSLRGLAWDFYSLMVAMFLFGGLTPIVVMNNIKACGTWFSRR